MPPTRQSASNAGNRALANFLRSRRERLAPESVDDAGRRRVRGLRREEVAARAGVSPEYYRRLEQGRQGNVSEAVLAAIARALELTPDEQRYLVEITHPALSRPAPLAPQVVEPGHAAMLDALTLQPSMIVGRRMDILAANPAAAAVFWRPQAIERGNVARFVFLDPLARVRHVNWHETAAMVASILRRRAGERPGDPAMHALLDELGERSPEFAALWTRERIELSGGGRTIMFHDAVGEYRLHAASFRVPADPEQTLVIHTAKRGSASEAALRRLVSSADALGA